MAVELTANAAQTVAAGANVLFTDTPVKCGRGYVVHRDGAGLVTLRGICNGCSPIARYRVLFVGNISVPTGGTAGAISVALALGGAVMPISSSIDMSRATHNAHTSVNPGCISVPAKNLLNVAFGIPVSSASCWIVLHCWCFAALIRATSFSNSGSSFCNVEICSSAYKINDLPSI